MNVLVTGSNGFIGKNLIIHLNELNINVLTYTRENSIQDLPDLIKKSNFIIHLAGENRPKNEKDFNIVNVQLTKSICESIQFTGKHIPIILASSTQAAFDSAYGKSKLDAELILKKLESDTGNPIHIYRLPGVFGKWCKPDYNSVVATFCYNVSNNHSIKVNDSSLELNLVYIDDVVGEFINIIQKKQVSKKERSIQPEYKIKLGDLATQIELFKETRKSLISERVGVGFVRKLYSTYVSYLPPKQFSYSIPSYGDDRGMFAEILKTKDSGQFSFFIAKQGVTRGGHYHHTKTEKFLVVQGEARFNFRHIISNETYDINTSGNKLKIIQTVPGWSHDITNIGVEDVIVMLWANEILDRDNIDTVTHKV